MESTYVAALKALCNALLETLMPLLFVLLFLSLLWQSCKYLERKFARARKSLKTKQISIEKYDTHITSLTKVLGITCLVLLSMTNGFANANGIDSSLNNVDKVMQNAINAFFIITIFIRFVYGIYARTNHKNED